MQTFNIEHIACGFESDSKVGPSLRRIQRFISEYTLDPNLIAMFIFCLLPHQPPYRLAMDRTNWKFGSIDINILVLAAVCKGVAFPLKYKMIPKSGNSSTTERIELMDRFILLFGADKNECQMADRKFIGQHWIAYLNGLRIPYHIRKGKLLGRYPTQWAPG